MSAVDYHDIAEDMATHLQTKLGTGYLCTSSRSTALQYAEQGIGVVVVFNRFRHMEELSQTVAPTRDAEYRIGIAARGESDDDVKEKLDDAVSAIEYILNEDHAAPPFGHFEIERCIATDGEVIEFPGMGQAGFVTATVRIMEV